MKNKIENWLFWLIFSLTAVFFISLVFVFYYAGWQLEKTNGSQIEQSFIVSEGEGTNQIAENLESAGLIENSFWFKIYVFYRGWAGRMQAGEYFLSPSLNVIQIARKISGGDIESQAIEITIPEGFTLRQIDDRLTKAGLIELGVLASKKELEGYLFPDTYFFDKEDSLDEIIAKMRSNFDKKLNDELKNEIEKQGKAINEIITMASILEKEVTGYEDMRIVSGIFWQRIKDNYPLQSCATLAYILGVDKWRYSTEDTKVDSLYNTYQHKGLPPGPINNPGLLAIQAAIRPQSSDYYFFLSKPTGETVFSRTLEEHNANKRKYLE